MKRIFLLAAALVCCFGVFVVADEVVKSWTPSRIDGAKEIVVKSGRFEKNVFDENGKVGVVNATIRSMKVGKVTDASISAQSLGVVQVIEADEYAADEVCIEFQGVEDAKIMTDTDTQCVIKGGNRTCINESGNVSCSWVNRTTACSIVERYYFKNPDGSIIPVMSPVYERSRVLDSRTICYNTSSKRRSVGVVGS